MERLELEQPKECLLSSALTIEEIVAIMDYTEQKILSYPKGLGKTLDNYFDILFPDEVKNFLHRRETNKRSLEILKRREIYV